MNIDLIDQINNWGKNSFLKYGLIETIINIGLILILAFIVSKLLKKFIHRHYKGNKLFILRLKHSRIQLCDLWMFKSVSAFF